MTIAERNNKLKHFITCLKYEVSGKCCDDNCSIQYDASNMGEIIENLEAISKALEQETVSKESYDHEYFLRKEFEIKIDKLQRQIEEQSLEQEPTTNSKTLVSLDVYKQVAWERDIAIQQLHELGYEFGEKIEPTTKNDLVLIHTEGLDEEIRCTMCTNYMKSDRGCDGSCVVNKDMYKAVMDAIEKRIPFVRCGIKFNAQN